MKTWQDHLLDLKLLRDFVEYDGRWTSMQAALEPYLTWPKGQVQCYNWVRVVLPTRTWIINPMAVRHVLELAWSLVLVEKTPHCLAIVSSYARRQSERREVSPYFQAMMHTSYGRLWSQNISACESCELSQQDLASPRAIRIDDGRHRDLSRRPDHRRPLKILPTGWIS